MEPHQLDPYSHEAPPMESRPPTEPRPHRPRPTEPRPHGVLPGAGLHVPGAPGDLEARAFLKKLLEQSKTSSLVPTPRPISPTCPANPLSLLCWVNLVPCSGDAKLQRQREQGSMRCGVSAPIPSGQHLLLHPSPLFWPPHPQFCLQLEGTTRKRSDKNESGSQKYTLEEAAEGESQGLESRDQVRRERSESWGGSSSESRTRASGIGGLEQRTSQG